MFGHRMVGLLVGLAVSGIVHQAAIVPYDDALARQMLPLAAAAYGDNPDACLQNRYKNAEFVKGFLVMCDKKGKDTCYAYMALLHTEKVIVVSFSGTRNESQLQTEFAQGFGPLALFNGTHVNAYMLDIFNVLWASGMEAQLEALQAKYPAYQLWVTGHSLGGAFTSLASLLIMQTGRWDATNSTIYSFGTPRIGYADYAARHDALVPHHYRVVHRHDTVSQYFEFKLGYRHDGPTVWYDNDMSQAAFVRCAAEKDPQCAGAALPDRTAFLHDHRHYFNVKVTRYGKSGCPRPL